MPSTQSDTQSSPQTSSSESDAPVTADALVEEVSIDGMCGVY